MKSHLIGTFCSDKNVTVDTSEGNSTTVCQECIFPFQFDNETFHNCTNYGYTNIWCSVKVDKEAVHQEGFWQDCGICDCSCIQLPTLSVNGTFMNTSMNNGKHIHFFINSIFNSNKKISFQMKKQQLLLKDQLIMQNLAIDSKLKDVKRLKTIKCINLVMLFNTLDPFPIAEYSFSSS